MPSFEGLKVLRSGKPHEEDFRRFAALPSRGLFLDLGAHAGQSAASFHLVQPGWRILSLEPDPAMRWSLALTALALRGRMRFRMVGAGRRAGMATLHVPRAGGRRLEGEASFEASIFASDEPTRSRLRELAAGRELSYDAMERPMVRIDDLGLSPGAVKLDLQGGELAAIEGMLGTLRHHRPWVLMENNLHSRTIVELLRPLGYQPEGRFEELNLLLKPLSGR